MRRKAAVTTAAMTAAIVIGAGLAGCGGEPEPAATDGPLPSAAPTTAATVSPTPSPTAAEPTVRVAVKGGKVVSGKGRHDVKLGSRVVIEIVTDVADEVHLHGYDKEIRVRPGTPARLTFTADIPGVFELELHSGLLLCELQVR
ncbi:MAG: hypothetical protein GEU94_18265 [Micromonosporaceae bacterium]|nr:hypothetical protein [Micromonosporaceae bacterium]